MIKGVIFDIDDTLYSHKIHATPSATLKALKKLKEQGIHIGICTSRNYSELASVPDELRQYFEFEVCGTGAQCFSNGKIISSAIIDSSKADRLMNCLINNHIQYSLCDDQGNYYYCDYIDPQRAQRSVTWTLREPLYRNYQKDQPITTIQFRCKDEEQLKQIMENYPQFDYSIWGCFAMANRYGVDKGSGVKAFMDYFHLNKEEVMAFGDGCNDGQMLEAAGVGVAVQEAHVNCAACADYICDRSIERGGIYQALVNLDVIKEDKYDLKAFFFDIDFTTFDHTIDDIRPSTYYALRQLKEKGYVIGIATSRSKDEMVDLPKEFVEMMDVVITLGGACIYYKDDVQRSYFGEQICDVISYLDKNDITYRYVDDEGGFLNRNDDRGKIFDRLYHMIPPVKKYTGQKVMHLLYYPNFEEQAKEVEQLMPNATHSFLKVAVEVSPDQINKGTAILKAAEHFGYCQENTCAFGDSNNDKEMLQMARLGICMGNGNPALFQQVDYVTDNIDEEGLYNALVHFKIIESNKAFEK